MNILDLFTDLANRAPGDNAIEGLINLQPAELRDAIKSNNNEKLKQTISNKKYYANEVLVSVY